MRSQFAWEGGQIVTKNGFQIKWITFALWLYLCALCVKW